MEEKKRSKRSGINYSRVWADMLQIPAWSAGNELPQGDRARLAPCSVLSFKIQGESVQRGPAIQHVDFSLSYPTCPSCYNTGEGGKMPGTKLA